MTHNLPAARCSPSEAQSAQEQAIGQVSSLVLVGVTQFLQESFELLLVRGGHLHPREDSPVVRTVVSIVEQAYVPAAAHRVQKVHEGARPLGELETVQDLVLHRRRMTAHQMPDMEL